MRLIPPLVIACSLSLLASCAPVPQQLIRLDSTQPILAKDLGMQKHLLSADLTAEEVALYHFKLRDEEGKIHERWWLRTLPSGRTEMTILIWEPHSPLSEEGAYSYSIDGDPFSPGRHQIGEKRDNIHLSTSQSQGSTVETPTGRQSIPAVFNMIYYKGDYSRSSEKATTVCGVGISLEVISFDAACKCFPKLNLKKQPGCGSSWSSDDAPLPPDPSNPDCQPGRFDGFFDSALMAPVSPAKP
ncbi:MAG: hypothetical protein RL095_596 [Verrucomicrobiota bacterium]